MGPSTVTPQPLQQLWFLALSALLFASASACGDSGDEAAPGRALRSELRGRVVLDRGCGLESMDQVRVRLDRGEGEVRLAEDGSFVFEDLEPDFYQITIDYEGRVGDAAASDPSPYRPWTTSRVVPADTTVVLEPAVLEPGVGSVEGAATLPTGLSLSGAEVRLSSPQRTLTAPITEAGYAFAQVPVGCYQLRFDAPAARLDGSERCGPEVQVQFDGQLVMDEDLSLAASTLRITPADSAAVELDATGTRWFTRAASVVAAVEAPFAAEARVWRASEAAPAFAPFDDGRFELAAVEGASVEWRLQFRDPCGFESEPRSVFVVRDSEPPVIEFARLAGSADYLTDRVTSLAVSAADALSDEMELQYVQCSLPAGATEPSPDCRAAGAGTEGWSCGDFGQAAWRPFRGYAVETLTLEVGTSSTGGAVGRGVRLRLRDRAGNTTERWDCGVFVDDVAPELLEVAVSDGGAFASQDVVARSREIQLRVRASERLASLRVGTDAGLLSAERFEFGGDGVLDTFEFRLPAPSSGASADFTLFLQARDLAGNPLDDAFPLSVRLDLTGGLTGRVALEDGAVPEGVDVTLAGTSQLTRTASTGAWRLEGLPPGLYTVVLEEPRYRTERLVGVEVRSGVDLDVGPVTLGVQRGELAGRVSLDGQGPLGNAGAVVEVVGQETLYNTTTGADGSWGLSLPVGAYYNGFRVRAERFEARVEGARFDIRDRVVLPAPDVRLAQNANDIEGRVTRLGETDHSGLRVDLVHLEGSATDTVFTDASGLFAFRNLPFGSYELVYSDPGSAREVRRSQVRLQSGLRLQLGTIALRQLYMTVAGGAPLTRTRDVQVEFGAPGCVSIGLSESSAFASVQSLDCVQGQGSGTYTLSPGDGDKTLFGRFDYGTGTPSGTVTATLTLDSTAQISRCTHDARAPLGRGDAVRFELDAGEAGAAEVEFGPYRVSLVDDGTNGDLTAGDGRFSRDYVVDAFADTNGAPVGCTFVDEAGNVVSRSASPSITVAIPPGLYSLDLVTDPANSQATLSYHTDEPTTGTVEHGPDDAVATTPALVPSEVTASVTSPIPGHHYYEVVFANLAGGRYCYRLSAADAAGNTTGTSVRCFDLVPGRPEYPAAMAGIQQEVWVRWEAPEQDNLAGFEVYRQWGPSGSPSRISGSQPIFPEDLMFHDTFAGVSTLTSTPYYTVRSVDTAGQRSLPSVLVSAMPGPSNGPTYVACTRPQCSVGGLMNEARPYVFDARGSPYILEGALRIEDPAYLVMGPGAELQYALPNRIHDLTSFSRLALLGTGAAPVRIGPASTSPNSQLRITLDSTPDGGWRDPIDRGYRAGAVLSHARLEGVSVSVRNRYPSATLLARTELAVRRIGTTAYAGSLQAARCDDTTRCRDDLTVVSSTIGSFLSGPWTYYRAPGELDVVGSRVDGQVTGDLVRIATSTVGAISARSTSSRCFAARSRIEGNGVTNCDVSGSVIAPTRPSGLRNVTIAQSRLEGVYSLFGATLLASRVDLTSTYGTPSSYPYVLRINNSAGMVVSGNHLFGEPVAGRAGVELRYAAAQRYVFSGNSFLGRTTPGSTFYARAFRTTCTVSAGCVADARGNYWGDATADMDRLGARRDILAIDDIFDGQTGVEIDYGGWASGPFPLPFIAAPDWGHRVRAGDTVQFRGKAQAYVSGAYQDLPATALTWRDASGTLLGAGATYQTRFPAGQHDIYLHARDGANREARTLVRVDVIQ